MKSLIRKWLIGDTVFSEYTKITSPDDLHQRVWLNTQNDTCDISNQHWLLCIHPIVFGVWIEDIHIQHDIEIENQAKIYFGGRPDPAENSVKEHEAEIDVSVVEKIREENGTLFLMQLTDSGIRHITMIKRSLIYFRYYRKGGLTYSRFKSYVSAYSFPRRIRIVSFREKDYYNLFPMDLLGEISHEKKWVFGLRHSNKALSKIISTRKIVVCEVPYAYKEKIYELGNHHSTNPPPLESLGIDVKQSLNFKFHIPVWADSYKEIVIRKNFNLGSHMLLWGDTVSETDIRKPSEHLYLVHFLHFLEQKKKGVEYMVV